MREYYSKNMSTYPIRMKINNADTYPKQLNEEGQFEDLIAYEKEIHDRNWLKSVSFKTSRIWDFTLPTQLNACG